MMHTGDKPVVPRSVSNAVVALLFVHVWFAQTTLDFAQIATELLLALVMIWILLSCTLTWLELLLVLAFAVTTAVSMAYNSTSVVLLNAKIFGLSILCLLVFSKLHFDETISKWIFLANITMQVYQAAFGDPSWFLSIVASIGGSWSQYTNSRPLGLFISTHVSATLTAIYFLSLARRRPAAGVVGFGTLMLTRSFFVTGAYLLQLGYRLLARFGLDKLVLAIGAVIAALVVLNAQAVLDFDLASLSSYFSEREQLSYSAIGEQILSWEAYAWAFTLVPLDSKALAGDFINWAGNEVGYFTLMQQGGFILAALYLCVFFPRIRGFGVFMAASLLHYGMATTPVIVFLLLQWAQHSQKVAQPAPTVEQKPDAVAPAGSV